MRGGDRTGDGTSGLMWRARRRRLRRRLERSLIAIPAAYLVGAVVLGALAALRAFERRDEQYAPDLTVTLALVLLIGAALLFLALLQRTMDRLRPRALYAAVSREAVDARLLHAGVEIGEERTIEQDPAFAMRIVVDTAIRALSPAVNDPTTAVQRIDVLEPIVRELAARDLEASFARGGDGRVRLVWPSPGWEDVLDLAFDEIRAYGASSIQICRRMRAGLADLRATVDPIRHAALDAQLARLDAAVAAAHGDDPLARAADRTGIGLARRQDHAR